MLSPPIVKRNSRLNVRYRREMGVHDGRGSRDGLPGVRSSVATGFIRTIVAGGLVAARLI